MNFYIFFQYFFWFFFWNFLRIFLYRSLFIKTWRIQFLFVTGPKKKIQTLQKIKELISNKWLSIYLGILLGLESVSFWVLPVTINYFLKNLSLNFSFSIIKKLNIIKYFGFIFIFYYFYFILLFFICIFSFFFYYY